MDERQPAPRAPLITFLSDFGTTDVFVGLCHGAIAAAAPQARVIDLTHAVPPQDVVTGACRLEDCVGYLPPAVHLGVVDPGVGTQRLPIIVACDASDPPSYFVGPDNGLLIPAARRIDGPTAAWRITVAARNPSATFHGRDVFAPAAALLAAGTAPAELGVAIDPEGLTDLVMPKPTVEQGKVTTSVRDIDAFGNVQLFASYPDLAALDGDESLLDVTAGATRMTVPVTATFGNLAAGQIGIIVDSFGWLAIVAAGGNAAVRLDVGRGDPVHLATPQA